MAAALADRLPLALRGARWRLSLRALVGIAAVLGLVASAITVVAFRDRPELVAAPSAVLATQTVDAADRSAQPSEAASAPAGVVVVHVAGLVAQPGVIELPLGSRVVDALRAAGGALPGVDTSTLNLARLLVDGEQIAVGVPPATDASGGAAGDGTAAGPGALLDLNQATEEQLDALPGVGPVLAGRIVAWREEHGRFSTVDELLEVSGIGSATLAELAALVRV